MLSNKHTIFVAAYAFITEIVIITYLNIYNTPTNLKKPTTTQIILLVPANVNEHVPI